MCLQAITCRKNNDVLGFFPLSVTPLSGVLQVTVNMAADVLSPGALSTVTAPTAATEEPPVTAVSEQLLESLRFSLKMTAACHCSKGSFLFKIYKKMH